MCLQAVVRHAAIDSRRSQQRICIQPPHGQPVLLVCILFVPLFVSDVDRFMIATPLWRLYPTSPPQRPLVRQESTSTVLHCSTTKKLALSRAQALSPLSSPCSSNDSRLHRRPTHSPWRSRFWLALIWATPFTRTTGANTRRTTRRRSMVASYSRQMRRKSIPLMRLEVLSLKSW